MQEEVPFPEQKSKHRVKPQLVFNRPPVVSPLRFATFLLVRRAGWLEAVASASSEDASDGDLEIISHKLEI